MIGLLGLALAAQVSTASTATISDDGLELMTKRELWDAITTYQGEWREEARERAGCEEKLRKSTSPEIRDPQIIPPAPPPELAESDGDGPGVEGIIIAGLVGAALGAAGTALVLLLGSADDPDPAKLGH